MATQYDPIAKDESLNTTELTPRNIADVLAEGLDDIVSALGGGSLEDLNDVAIVTPSNGQTLKYNSTTQKWENANDAGGHTIIDPDGTSMTQRAGLAFVDAHVSDDAVNDETEIEIVEAISKTDWDNLDPTDPSNNGLYEINDPNNSPIFDASMVAYGNGTVDDALDGLTSDSGWKTSTAIDNHTIQYRKIGNQVWIRRNDIGTISANTLTVIATLPSEYRPSRTVQTAVVSESTRWAEIVINATTGNVSYLGDSADYVAAFLVPFLVD